MKTIPITLAVVCVVAAVAARMVGPIASDASSRQPVSTASETYSSKPNGHGASPRAVVEKFEHDFGVMDPQTKSSHRFVVKNTGTKPLKLALGETTCKCTFGKLGKSTIEPGEQGNVILAWKTGFNDRDYSHAARIHTNDPENRVIDLRVRGIVRVKLAMDPPEFVFAHVAPGSAESMWMSVFTQSWKKFEVVDVTSTLEGLTWSVEPLSREQLDEHAALAGSRVRVTIPNSLPQGFFQHELTMHVLTEETESPVPVRVPIRGKVLRRLAVYGNGIDANGVISLGIIESDKPHTKRFMLKVRDDQRKLDLNRVAVKPDFVNVKIRPKGDESRGLYEMILVIPADPPIRSLSASNPGRLHVEFDHPRINDLDLQLTYTAIAR